MGSRAVFEKNLAALRKRHRGLVERLEETSCEDIEVVSGPRGAEVLKDGGVLLGSAYDPEREAEGLARRMGEAPADVMIAVGLGLGLQLEHYCRAHPCTLIVYEPSLPRLRAVLEQRSFVNLLATNRDLHFATDLDRLTQLIDARYVPGLRLRVFPHPAVLRLDPEGVAAAVERVRFVKEANDTRTLTSIEQLMPWAWIVACNGRRIAESPTLGRAEGAFRGKPAVVVAAGPSLDKQLPLLREMQDRVLVIAIGQTARALREAGIEPDLVHVLESRDVSHQLRDAGPTEELCVALSPDAHHALYDVPTRARFVVPTGGSPMCGWIMQAIEEPATTLSGGTVAQGAVGMALMLGASPIVLIGQDLAFTDGRAYAKGSAYDFVQVELDEQGSCRFTNMKQKVGLLGDRDLDQIGDESKTGRVVWVDGWHEGERVPTWRAYASFLEQYRQIGEYLGALGVELVNCTEGGARIHGVSHRPFREVLEAHATEPFDARDRLLAIHDDTRCHDLGDFAPSIAEARRVLDQVESSARKAIAFARRTRDRLLGARNDQQRVEILRGLARHEKRIRRALERIPWLDALVQPEIYNAIAAFRRTERLEPTDEDLANESMYLFVAAKNGVGRARQWFEGFEASFESDAACEAVAARIAARTEVLRADQASQVGSVPPVAELREADTDPAGADQPGPVPGPAGPSPMV